MSRVFFVRCVVVDFYIDDWMKGRLGREEGGKEDCVGVD